MMRLTPFCTGLCLAFSGSAVESSKSADGPVVGILESASDFLNRGEVSGSVGAAVWYQDNHFGPNPGLSWGYLDISYRTPDWNGLALGAAALGVSRIWENGADDFDNVFREPWDLRDFYLSYQSEKQRVSALVGRKLFPTNPVLDGDSQQGVGIELSDDRGSGLWLAAFNRWEDHSTPNYDADGITGWEDVSAANDSAGEVYLAAMGNGVIGGFTGSPFLSWQDDVLGVYGVQAEYGHPLEGPGPNAQWASELIVAYYDNLAPASVEPDYEDLWVGRIHTGYESDTWSAGAGFFWMGDGRVNTEAGLFTTFDPLKDDDLDPFNDQNNTYLFYLNATVQIDSLTLQPAIGYGRNRAEEADVLEIDFLFSWDLPGDFVFEGYLVHSDFGPEVLPSYTESGVSLAYEF